MKFNIGDVVVVLVCETDNGIKRFPVGTIGIISNIVSFNRYPYKVAISDNDYWYYKEDEFELYVGKEDKNNMGNIPDVTIANFQGSIINIRTLLTELQEQCDKLQAELDSYKKANETVKPSKITVEVEFEKCPYWDYEKHDLMPITGDDCRGCTCRTNGNTVGNLSYGMMIGKDRWCTVDRDLGVNVKEASKEDV